MVSFPEVSPPEPCAHLFPPPSALHAPPISLFSILPPAQQLTKLTLHKDEIVEHRGNVVIAFNNLLVLFH